MATDLAPQILDALSSSDHVLSSEAFPAISTATVKGALDRLNSREMVIYETLEKEEVHLTDEAKAIASEGSHEAKVFEVVRKAVEGLQIDRLPVRLHAYEASGFVVYTEDINFTDNCSIYA